MLSTIPSGTGRALAKQSSLGVMLKEVHQLVASMGKLLCLVIKQHLVYLNSLTEVQIFKGRLPSLILPCTWCGTMPVWVRMCTGRLAMSFNVFEFLNPEHPLISLSKETLQRKCRMPC